MRDLFLLERREDEAERRAYILKRAKKLGGDVKGLKRKFVSNNMKILKKYLDKAVLDYKEIKIGDVLFEGCMKYVVTGEIQIFNYSLGETRTVCIPAKGYYQGFSNEGWQLSTTTNCIFCSDRNLINGGYNNHLLFRDEATADEYSSFVSKAFGHGQDAYKVIKTSKRINNIDATFPNYGFKSCL